LLRTLIFGIKIKHEIRFSENLKTLFTVAKIANHVSNKATEGYRHYRRRENSGTRENRTTVAPYEKHHTQPGVPFRGGGP